jgi:hypothetical protein
MVLGILGIVSVILTVIRSVHVKVKVNVREITPGDAAPADGPKFSFEKQVQVEHGKPIQFGAKTSLPK